MTQQIIKATITNFMGIGGTIEFFPKGPLQLIAGPNGSGKSSLIQSFEEIFDPKGTRLIPKPIHDGAEEARAEIETTEARIVRVWKKNGPGTLSVYALDGAKYPSGKDFILKATGGALFDPQQFVNLPEKEQRDQLLARVELPFDLDTLDKERKGIFDGRTDVNREVSKLENQLAGFPGVDESLPQEEQSASELMRELEAVREHNAERETLWRAATDAEVERDNAEAHVARLIEELDAARAHLERAKDVQATTLERYKAFDVKDDAELRERLNGIDALNARVRQQRDRERVAAELSEKKERAAKLTLSLQEIDKRKADALAAAKFPVDGLSVDESGITYNGVPFKQVNTARKTAIAFDLATLPQPDLRLIVIKDGDSLDADSLAEIERIASERGYIALVERDRDESRQIGFTIVDGEVSA